MPRLKDRPAMIEQMLEAMRRQPQRGGIGCFAVAIGMLFKLCLEDVIDLFLDRREFGFVAGMTNSFSEIVERVERPARSGAEAHELPGGGKKRSQRAEQHGPIKQLIAVFVEKGLFVTVEI